MRILITGASGLLGFHLRACLLARNAAAVYQQLPAPYEVLLASRADLAVVETLASKTAGCDVIVHLAGVNRTTPENVKVANQQIATQLVQALATSGARPQIVYANTTHYERDSDYGNDKRKAGELLEKWSVSAGAVFSNLVIPHVFGEGGVPFYNTVTATLCHQLVKGESPTINSGAEVELLHAGEVADHIMRTVHAGQAGVQRLAGTPMTVADLYLTLQTFKQAYDRNTIPDVSESLTLQLFNTYRAFEFPVSFPRTLHSHDDERGTLFEAIKGGGGGQTFLSWTKPGVVRGNHFHRHKVERFLVLQGTAKIGIRRIFDNEVHEFFVSGETPQVIDMPTLYTHNIMNTGSQPLLTLFWAHEQFDPENPDTYAHAVDEQQEP